jgi:hypothetical protein
MDSKFKIGDRVTRRLRFRGEPERHGTITDVKFSFQDYMHQSHIVYSVLWDDTKQIEVGYLEIGNGLELEAT